MSGTVLSKYLMSCFTSEGFLKTSTVNFHLYVREPRNLPYVTQTASLVRAFEFTSV